MVYKGKRYDHRFMVRIRLKDLGGVSRFEILYFRSIEYLMIYFRYNKSKLLVSDKIEILEAVSIFKIKGEELPLYDTVALYDYYWNCYTGCPKTLKSFLYSNFKGV